MALELPIVLGTKTTTAAIVLYGFLQQNLLFDAFANKLGAAGNDIAFLFDLANVFAMIGLLILLFSPSLWKAKYIASWIFLFAIVVLGGSTGPEFGYNFTDINNSAYDDYFSQKVEINGYECNIDSALGHTCAADRPEGADVGVDGLPSIKDITINSSANSFNNNGGGVNDVYGFYPQVLIMYVTNKLKYSLKKALFDLSEKQFAKRVDMLRKMRAAKLPNPQLSVWVSAFDELCGAQVAERTKLNTAEFLALPASDVGRYPLSNEPFLVKDLMRVIKQSEILQQNDKRLVTPLINFEVGVEGPDVGGLSQATLRINDIANGYLDGKAIKVRDNGERYLKRYTIHGPLLAQGPVLYDDIGNDMPAWKKHIKNARIARENSTNKDLHDQFVADYGNEVAGLVIPKNLDKVSQLNNSEDSKYKKIQKDSSILIKSTDDLPVVAGCNSFYDKLKRYYKDALIVDTNDFKKQVELYEQNSYAECRKTGVNVTHGGVGNCVVLKKKALAAKGLSPELEAKREYVQATSEVDKLAQVNNGSEEKQKAQYALNNIETYNIKNAINNSFIAKGEALMRNLDKQDSMTSGLTGAGFAAGGFVTELFKGIALKFKSFFLGIEAGAYATILPIVKDILTAFVLVLTPILFLIGLMVPKWAPGVILTSLLALAYLQMIDVVMLVVTTALSAVEKAITSGNLELLEDHKSFLMCIWAMAYMASFAITAFLMFKAGDTSFIMGKLTSADAPIKSTGNAVFDVGKKVGQFGLAAASAGTIGTPIAIGTGGKVFNKALDVGGDLLAAAENYGTGVTPLQKARHEVEQKAAKQREYSSKVRATNNTLDGRPSAKQQMAHLESTESNKLEDKHGEIKRDTAQVKGLDGQPIMRMDRTHAEAKDLKRSEHDFEDSLTSDQRRAMHEDKRTQALYKAEDDRDESVHNEGLEYDVVDGKKGVQAKRSLIDRKKKFAGKKAELERYEKMTDEQKRTEYLRESEDSKAKLLNADRRNEGIVGGIHKNVSSRDPETGIDETHYAGAHLEASFITNMSKTKEGKALLDKYGSKAIDDAIVIGDSVIVKGQKVDSKGKYYNTHERKTIKKGEIQRLIALDEKGEPKRDKKGNIEAKELIAGARIDVIDKDSMKNIRKKLTIAGYENDVINEIEKQFNKTYNHKTIVKDPDGKDVSMLARVIKDMQNKPKNKNKKADSTTPEDQYKTEKKGPKVT